MVIFEDDCPIMTEAAIHFLLNWFFGLMHWNYQPTERMVGNHAARKPIRKISPLMPNIAESFQDKPVLVAPR